MTSPRPLPEGRYFSLTPGVDPDAGGQTRAMLMRNRMLARAGAHVRLLTVTPHDDLDRRRELLHERGLLIPEVPLLNIFEHYQERDWPERGSDRPLPDLGAGLRAEEALLDGTPWRRHYVLEDGSSRWDYLRRDGSTWLRTAELEWREPRTWGNGVLKVSRDGRVVGSYRNRGQWWREWVRELSEGEPTFVFLDSRFMVPLVTPFQAPHVHLLYLMHNIHVSGDHRWDRPFYDSYAELMRHADGLDALVTLTARQREDLVLACGPRTTMHVVSNPVDLPEPPPAVERDPHQVTVMARLTAQKHLGDAVRVMEKVVAQVPEARLDVFGRGYQHEQLARLARRLGLADHVTMRGHDPDARRHLWRSSAFLMTSRFEGYPLSTLESMSHGCPVVSYDIRYGPREQITDGVDGFLVDDGDIDAMAERVVRMLRDPALVARMSEAARTKAEQHDHARFLADWSEVVHAVVEERPRRLRLERAELDVRRLRVGRGRGAVWPSRHRPGDRLHLRADLHLRAEPDGTPAPEDLHVELVAVHAVTGRRVEVPLRVGHRRREPGTIRLAADAPLADLLGGPDTGADTGGDTGGDLERVRLRLFVGWRNLAWTTALGREQDGPAGLETAYEEDGTWVLTRRPGAS